MIKEIKAALARVAKKGLDSLQAGPRSAQSHPLNYLSVTTLDPRRLARAFAAADQGFITEQAALFEMIEEQDAHIFSELAKRRRSVTGLGWQLHPCDDASQSEIDRTVELADMLRKIPHFEDAQYDFTDAIGKGFMALEINWKTGSEWVPQELLWVPQREFQTDNNISSPRRGDLLYLKNGIPEPLRPWGWIVHEHRAKSGYIEQAALFRVLAWTYAYKAYNVRDMQRFLEVYGLPLRLGKYPAGINDKQRDALLKAVRNIGHDGAGIVPQTMTIDFIQATKTGTVDDFLNAISYWERKQSLAILGGTLTSQADGKSSTNALGLIHDKVRREIMLHDVQQIEPTITSQLIKPIALLNGIFPEARLPHFVYQTEESVDQQKMVNVLTKAVAIGMEIDVGWAHETMQIPRADENAKKLAFVAKTEEIIDPEKDADPEKADDPEKAGLTLRAMLSSNPESLPDAYAARLATLCAPFEEAIIQQITAIVAESGDFDEAMEKIAALKRDEKNYQAWVKTLAEGMAAAHLAGRGSIQQKDKK